jgi:hypothetical protein
MADLRDLRTSVEDAASVKKELTADFRCVCTSEKQGRSPERPLSSSCPIQFAGAVNVGSQPLM